MSDIKCPHCGKEIYMQGEGPSAIPDSTDAVHYVVNHSADTTETGLPMKRTYVRMLWAGHKAHALVDTMLRDWCRERFGPETDYVQGVAPVPSWSIGQIDRARFDRADPIKWGGYPMETKRLVIQMGRKSGLDRQPMIEVIHEETTTK